MGIFHKPISGARVAVKLSFENWVKNHKAYAALYKTLPDYVTKIAFDAIESMEPLRPETYQFWWAGNHDAYIRTGAKQRELLLINEIFYYFMCAYARGELKRNHEPTGTTTGKEKTKQKTTA